jgi:hypothetical protein
MIPRALHAASRAWGVRVATPIWKDAGKQSDEPTKTTAIDVAAESLCRAVLARVANSIDTPITLDKLGGHWFEPSTAHLTKAPLDGVLILRCGGRCEANRDRLETIWKAGTRFCAEELVPDSAARPGVQIVPC